MSQHESTVFFLGQKDEKKKRRYLSFSSSSDKGFTSCLAMIHPCRSLLGRVATQATPGTSGASSHGVDIDGF